MNICKTEKYHFSKIRIIFFLFQCTQILIRNTNLYSINEITYQKYLSFLFFLMYSYIYEIKFNFCFKKMFCLQGDYKVWRKDNIFDCYV